MADKQIEGMNEYLGDGVYIYFNGSDFEVYTSDGKTKLNQIYLSTHEVTAFIQFLNRVYKEHAGYREQLGLAVDKAEMKSSHDAS